MNKLNFCQRNLWLYPQLIWGNLLATLDFGPLQTNNFEGMLFIVRWVMEFLTHDIFCHQVFFKKCLHFLKCHITELFFYLQYWPIRLSDQFFYQWHFLLMLKPNMFLFFSKIRPDFCKPRVMSFHKIVPNQFKSLSNLTFWQIFWLFLLFWFTLKLSWECCESSRKEVLFWYSVGMNFSWCQK